MSHKAHKLILQLAAGIALYLVCALAVDVVLVIAFGFTSWLTIVNLVVAAVTGVMAARWHNREDRRENRGDAS